MSRPLVVPIFAGTILFIGPAAGSEMLEPADRTIFVLRVASAVLEGYRDSHGQLPYLGTEPVPPSRIVEALGDDLCQEWRKDLSSHDGWGHALEYVLMRTHYTIISLGSDGREDVSDAELLSGHDPRDPESEPARDGSGRDIVLSDGALIQRPEPKRPPGYVAMSDLRSIGGAIVSYAELCRHQRRRGRRARGGHLRPR